MTPVRIVSASLGLLLVPILLSARDGGHPAATEPPAPTVPPTTVPATIVPVEPTTTTEVAPSTSTTAPETTTPGEVTAPTSPGEWPKVGGQGCTTPWGDEEPAWCDPRVRIWIRADRTCWVTPAGVAAHAVCPSPVDEEEPGVLPETAAGSRWA